MKHFFVIAFLLFVAGELLSDKLPPVPPYIILALILIPILLKRFYPLLFIGIFLAGAFLYGRETLREDRWFEKIFTACTVVSSPYYTPEYTGFSCLIFHSDRENL